MFYYAFSNIVVLLLYIVFMENVCFLFSILFLTSFFPFFSLTFSFPCSLRGLETHGLELVDWFSVGRAGFFGAQHTKKFINKYE